jgi:hypothetical protein
MHFHNTLGVKVRRNFLKKIANAVQIASEPLEQRTMLASIPVTTNAATGAGSLDQAIIDSNLSVGVLDTITFSIGTGPVTITPAAALPVITDPVVIDGTTQPGFTGKPIVEIDGASLSANGFDVTAGNTTIRGLIINRFDKVGIVLNSDNNVVEGNYIGTDSTGTIAEGNLNEGIFITEGSGNRIGGTTAAQRNIISGNDQEGINISGLFTPAVLDSTTMAVITPSSFVDSTDNTVEGNYIGTDVTGTLPLANTLEGITIFECDGNTIGGTAAGSGNVISGNGNDGIGISTALVDGSVGASANVIEGNLIGTDATGEVTATLGNTGDGIDIAAGNDNVIGGAGGARNIISGNGANGIAIIADTSDQTGANFVGANSNVIQNNYIGTNLDGTVALANTGNGIYIFGSSSTLIGGSTSGLGNVVSGNTAIGIDIVTFNELFIGIDADDSTVEGNLVGVGTDGNSLGNGGAGIELDGTTGTTIGGSAAADRNIISGNTGDGITVANAAFESPSSTTIQGNYIGTNPAGTTDRGNGGNGIAATPGFISSPTTDSISGNIISGNDKAGISLQGAQMDIVQGNWIGTNPSGATLGNDSEGILLNNATQDQIGGTGTGQGNVIAFNRTFGVGVTGTSESDSIQQNSIYDNGDLGIDLGEDGVTANDNGDQDADTGPNGLQNFPVLTSAVTTGSSTEIKGTLDSGANTTFIIELYSNDSADHPGQGRTHLLGISKITGAAGTTSFDDILPVGLTAGQFVTAIATDTSTNDTSEFSAALTATITTPPPTAPSISINDVSMTEGNSGQKNFVFTVKLSAASSSATSVFFATANGTALAPSDYVAIPSTKLTFIAGQTSKTITVKVNGDTTVEGNETFFVNLTSPMNGTISDSQGKGTIVNDDVAPPSGTVSIVTDPCDSKLTALKFVGTSNADTIVITNASANVQGKSIVTINGVNKGTFNFTGRILGYGGGGNDKITVDSHITRTAQIYGEAGNDTINGGSGNDLLFGGDGNDQLNGNAGRDILIGQLNNDSLNGGAGDDILIAGSTNYDNNFEALCDIQQEWFRTDLPTSSTYATRVNHLINGGGKNGNYKLNASTVFSSPDQPDTLTGAADNDLFYSASTGDKNTDKAPKETMVTVHS